MAPSWLEITFMKRPVFAELTPEQQANFGNGLGPEWLPESLRRAVTAFALLFFNHTAWRQHDFSYVVGGNAHDRARADRVFLRAMLKDTIDQPAPLWLLTAPIGLVLSGLFFIAVRLGGTRSFHYRNSHATIEEIRNNLANGANKETD